METYLENLAMKLNINLSKIQVDNFMKYKTILLETNKFLNLTSITDDKDVILKHFIDSLTINSYITQNSSLIDVGTGAGFPGIPIKIIRSDVSLTLLDSLQKRVNFLSNVVNELSLDSVNLIHGRAEDIGKIKEYRENFDFVTARAVANSSTLSELCLPFVKVNGLFICMKGSIEEELDEAKNAINALGGEIEKIEEFNLPDTDIKRTVILIRKIKNTPTKYPRKAGLPAKEPIK